MKHRRQHPQRTKTHCKFGELAALYYPDRSYKTATRLFRNEIECTPGLMDALTDEGYKRNQRVFNFRQINIITAFLGEVG